MTKHIKIIYITCVANPIWLYQRQMYFFVQNPILMEKTLCNDILFITTAARSKRKVEKFQIIIFWKPLMDKKYRNKLVNTGPINLGNNIK